MKVFVKPGFLSVFVILLFFLPLQIFSNEFKIVNGEDTTKEKWTESFTGVVGLMIELSEGLSSCTATLIDPQVVLTARHCVLDYDDYGNTVVLEPEKISVKSGLWVGYASFSHAEGKEIVINQQTDIALIFLNKRIPKLRVYPVRSDPSETVGEEGTIVGYGVTGSDKTDSGVQRWGETTVLSIWNEDGFFIEVGDPAGLCYGDSGGPLFTKQNDKDVVSGVTSFGDGNCSSTGGSYSVQVVKYRNWIEEQMEIFTGHDLENICGDGDIDEGEICEVTDEKDCAALGSYTPGIPARCNVNCNGYDLSVCKDQICGDHRKQGVEACDDGNVEEGDYCSADCTEITGKCGDNVVQSNEECDDGNEVSEDGCDLVCKIECGNGAKESNEECDDGNLDGGDGCDGSCKLECGNGKLNIGEECDDGNLLPQDGCDNLCLKEESNDSSGCTAVLLK